MRSRSRSLVVLALAVAVLAAGCSGGGGKKSDEPAKPDQSGNTPAVLKVGNVTVASYGPPDAKIPKDVQKTVLLNAQKYVNNAMAAPYTAGGLGPKYADLFALDLRKPATTSDKSVLTDAGIGKAKYAALAGPVTVSALADGSGKMVYLATNFSVTADLTGDAGPTRIKRDVELTWAPAGKQWIITAYRVRVKRTLPTGTTTTTSASSSGSTP